MLEWEERRNREAAERAEKREQVGLLITLRRQVDDSAFPSRKQYFVVSGAMIGAIFFLLFALTLCKDLFRNGQKVSSGVLKPFQATSKVLTTYTVFRPKETAGERKRAMQYEGRSRKRSKRRRSW